MATSTRARRSLVQNVIYLYFESYSFCKRAVFCFVVFPWFCFAESEVLREPNHPRQANGGDDDNHKLTFVEVAVIYVRSRQHCKRIFTSLDSLC